MDCYNQVNALSNAKKAADKIPEITDQLRTRIQVLRSKQSEIEKELSQLAHAVEAPMDAIRAAKFMAEFARLRRARRALKQQALVAKVAIANAEQPFNKFCQEVALQHDRNKGICTMAQLGADKVFARLSGNDPG